MFSLAHVKEVPNFVKIFTNFHRIYSVPIYTCEILVSIHRRPVYLQTTTIHSILIVWNNILVWDRHHRVIITARVRSTTGKVMFWHVSVCLSTGGVPISHNALQHYPECHGADTGGGRYPLPRMLCNITQNAMGQTPGGGSHPYPIMLCNITHNAMRQTPGGGRVDGPISHNALQHYPECHGADTGGVPISHNALQHYPEWYGADIGGGGFLYPIMLCNITQNAMEQTLGGGGTQPGQAGGVPCQVRMGVPRKGTPGRVPPQPGQDGGYQGRVPPTGYPPGQVRTGGTQAGYPPGQDGGYYPPAGYPPSQVRMGGGTQLGQQKE